MNQNMQTLSELLHKGKGDSDENIIASEIKQIKRGDVPYFYTYADSLSLYGDGEELIKNRFTMSAADHILDNLYSMNDKDKLFDLTYIDRAVRQYPAKLANHEQSVNIRPERKGVALSRDTALNEARKIFDEMYELRIPDPDNNNNNNNNKFLWGYVNSGSFALSFSDYTLYNGFTGMALFASALAYVYHDRRVNEFADYLVNEALHETGTLLERLRDNTAPIEEAEGLDGVLKALAVMKRYRNNKRLDDLCCEILEILNDTDFAKCSRSDIITGIAGLIAALCRFDEYREHENIIRSAAERLLDMKNFEYHGFTLWQTLPDIPRVLSGGWHGMTGIAQALFAAAEVLNDDKYIHAADEALNYELTLYNQYSDKLGSWPDMRVFPPKSYMHGYCCGAPGIGIALNRISNSGGEVCGTLKRFARDRVDRLPLNICDHLCCGNSAIVEYYLTAGDYDSAGEVLYSMYERRQDEGTYRFYAYNTNNGVTASLFQGLCGIGYEMLRYSFPDKINSII